MIYKNIFEGIFIKRINRFIAEVHVEGETQKVHVKNTGRCKELFIEGRTCFLEKSDNPNRKTNYSLISIYKNDMLINIDSQVPNAVIYESILKGQIPELNVTFLKREKTYGNSRFDLYYETDTTKGFIEVKGVTLEENGLAMFPDAPTTRGTKHVKELIQGQYEGYQNYIILLVQIAEVTHFKPNEKRDPPFADALRKAQEAGVIIKCFTSTNTRDSINLLKEIPYTL
jgi:sugar fermentation stimulation protein A